MSMKFTFDNELDDAYTTFCNLIAPGKRSHKADIKIAADKLRSLITSYVPQDECKCICGSEWLYNYDGYLCQCVCHSLKCILEKNNA
jgi:hypothetical protein